MLKNKVLMFGLLGAGGCLLGWLVGEGLLLASLPSEEEARSSTPSLITKPELPDLAPEQSSEPAPPPKPPPAPSVPKSTPPAAPELPELEAAREGPVAAPPPEFRERLERESGQQVGDVRITLIWNNFNDLDLHCSDPNGEEIFYSHNKSRSGGELDVDENVDPTTDKPVENIYWPQGGAPDGRYRVYVNHYMHHAGRAPSQTPFKVNLLVDGRQQNFEGTISYGDRKRLIHTFSLQPTIHLAVPEEVEVEQGGRNRIKIKIARERFRGEVIVRAGENVPEVTIPAVTLRDGQTEAEMEIVAGDTAVTGTHAVRMIATKGTLSAEALLKVVLKVVPPRLALAVPPEIELNQGGSNRLPVRIARVRFDEPVSISVEGASEDLSFGELTFEKGQSDGVLEIAAAAETPPGSQALKVIATGGGARAEGPLQLNVEELPRGLRLAVPEKIEVNQGGSNSMQIRVGRDSFRGPIETTVTGDMEGVTVPDLVLPDDRDGGELEIQATDDAPLGNRVLQVVVSGGGVQAESSVELVVNKVIPPSSGWSLGMILLIGVWTALLAIFLSLALVGGQNRYLRRPLFNMREIALLAGGGALVGLLAGGLGQILLLILTAAHLFPSVGFVIGWTLLGGLLGFGLSYFIPNLHGLKSAAAGAIGGVAGALVFVLVTNFGDDMVGRLMGALLLGLSIGLMVALVELAFRDAWVEACYGGSETVTVNLGPEPVKIGSDGRRCAIYARNAAPVAFRYWLDHGKVFCEDVEQNAVREMGADQSQQVGVVTVTVRTGSRRGAASGGSGTGFAKPLAPPPPPKKAGMQMPSSSLNPPTSRSDSAPTYPSTGTTGSSRGTTQDGKPQTPRRPPPPPKRKT